MDDDSDRCFLRRFVIGYAIVEAIVIASLIGGMLWTR
jgi:F0F1-type ATP synthase membrane subunit c/vacuolar-type H+-ATPase subunit K